MYVLSDVQKHISYTNWYECNTILYIVLHEHIQVHYWLAAEIHKNAFLVVLCDFLHSKF